MATGLCKDDPCAGVTCTTPPNPQCWNSPGQCSGGTCSYDKKAVDTTCTDGDPCTAGDKCDAAGTCVPGPAIVCPPRATACVSGASVVYTNPRCDSADGMCKYDEASTPCAFGCDPATGLCNADPCAGVTCNQPPVPQCYEAAGTCSGGQCSYTPRATGTLCDDGNPCTESDSCGADHLCAGTAMACPLPEPFCEADTVSKIAVDGGCEVADGQCHYQYRQVVCVAGCDVATGLCPGGVLISQFRVRGPAGGNDEFVELYNAGTAAAVIGGWKLNGSNNAGSVGTRATVPAGTSIGPRSFYLLANAGSSGYSGTVAADHTYTTGVTDDGGLALLDSTGAIVDQVGLSAGSAYKEGTPLAKMTGTADQSYLRATLDCGPDQDFGDNVADFSLGAATPRNSKSCRPACAGDGCVGNPPATCVDAGTSKAYPSGVCETGACTYPEVTTACDWGCDAASGLCKPDPCAGKTCDTPPATGCWEAAGTCVAGECVYTPKGVVACDDGDACTLGDMCDAAGACAGTVMTCDTPPAGDCWVASGACEAGACVYPGKPETVGCDDGDACTSDDHCDGLGACAGTMDPCDPPPPFCMTGADVSVVPMAGTCTDGQCMWPTTEVPCPWGCDDDTGSCVPDPCLTGTCVTPPGPCYQPTGTCVDGKCVYQALAQGDPCDDGDWCTDPDTCGANLECHGTAVVCAPLDPACLDDDTSVTFTGGTCDPAQGGQCVYDKHETTCDHGCDAATGLCEDDPCATVTCDAPPSTCHRSPGTCADGECSYSLKPATSSCDDGDECTVLDACDADGKCAGEAKACETPPDPECVDGKSRGYSPKGTCGAGGTCTYAFADTACASGCDEASGLCVGDACIGKTCDAPPGPCHVATGTCFNGKCSYLPRDAGFACDDGDPCTADSACDGAGTCVGGTAVPECQPEPVADAAEPVPEPTPDGAAEAGPEAAEPSPDVHITWDYVPSEVAAEAGPDAGGGEGGGGNCAAGPDGQGAAWLLALVALAVLRRRTFAARA
jgi:MYXO-CTERM domain-containing protein